MRKVVFSMAILLFLYYLNSVNNREENIEMETEVVPKTNVRLKRDDVVEEEEEEISDKSSESSTSSSTSSTSTTTTGKTTTMYVLKVPKPTRIVVNYTITGKVTKEECKAGKLFDAHKLIKKGKSKKRLIYYLMSGEMHKDVVHFAKTYIFCVQSSSKVSSAKFSKEQPYLRKIGTFLYLAEIIDSPKNVSDVKPIFKAVDILGSYLAHALLFLSHLAINLQKMIQGLGRMAHRRYQASVLMINMLCDVLLELYILDHDLWWPLNKVVYSGDDNTELFRQIYKINEQIKYFIQKLNDKFLANALRIEEYGYKDAKHNDAVAAERFLKLNILRSQVKQATWLMKKKLGILNHTQKANWTGREKWLQEMSRDISKTYTKDSYEKLFKKAKNLLSFVLYSMIHFVNSFLENSQITECFFQIKNWDYFSLLYHYFMQISEVVYMKIEKVMEHIVNYIVDAIKHKNNLTKLANSTYYFLIKDFYPALTQFTKLITDKCPLNDMTVVWNKEALYYFKDD